MIVKLKKVINLCLEQLTNHVVPVAAIVEVGEDIDGVVVGLAKGHWSKHK